MRIAFLIRNIRFVGHYVSKICKREVVGQLVGFLIMGTILTASSFSLSLARAVFAEYEEIFVMAYPADVGEMNPLFSRSERTRWYLIQVYDSLIAYDTNMNPIPWLARDWSISNDAKNFTFYIREGVKWHTGIPLNASDLKFTLDYIKAAPKDALGWSLLQKMEECTVHDEHTVSVTFNESMGFGLMQVGEINIVPKHIRDWGDWENGNSQHAECWDDPDNVIAHTGSGPFKFKERVPEAYILLEKNLDWWGKEPNVDGIRIEVVSDQSARILAMRQGIVDTERYALMGGADIQAVLDAPELKVITGVASQWDYVLGFNLTISGFDDPTVRKAICYALDRDEIIEVARGGYCTATWSTIPEVFFPAYYDEEGRFPRQNITYANEILDDAGYLDSDDDGIRNFPYPNNDTQMTTDLQVLSWDTISVDAAIAISDELKEIGIFISVSITDDAVMWPNIYALPRNYRLYEMSHGFSGYPEHVWHRMHSVNDIDWGDNCYGLHNATMDAALDNLLHATNDTARTAAAKEVQKLSVELAPYIPLFLSDATHAIRNEWVNYTFVPGGIFTSINRLTMLNIYSAPVVTPEAPTIESCDSSDARKDVFDLGDTVYATGEGYAPSLTAVSSYDIYVVNDVAWADGMTIPARIPGTVTTITSDHLGNIPPTAVWPAPLTPGKYDIVVDVDGDGLYYAESDALDDNDIEVTAGFFVIPEYWIGTISALIGCFASLGVFHVHKRKRQ